MTLRQNLKTALAEMPGGRDLASGRWVANMRERVLQRPDTVIAAGHFADGVFGRVTAAGDTHMWTPVGHMPTSE